MDSVNKILNDIFIKNPIKSLDEIWYRDKDTFFVFTDTKNNILGAAVPMNKVNKEDIIKFIK